MLRKKKRVELGLCFTSDNKYALCYLLGPHLATQKVEGKDVEMRGSPINNTMGIANNLETMIYVVWKNIFSLLLYLTHVFVISLCQFSLNQ